MATDKVSVDFDFNGVTLRIQGAKYFYDDSDIRTNIGADVTDENDLGGRVIIDQKAQWQRILVPLVAVMKKDGAAGIGNAAQSDNVRYFNFLCHPNKVGEAFDDLPGKAIDANLLPGDWEIQKVMIPLSRCYE